MSEKIFYSMPFRAERLVKKGELEKCDLAASVRQNLRLLLITPPVRVKFDPYYGCKVHWFQFLATNRAMERKKEEDDFKYKMEQNITTLIERFEPRVQLKEVNVSIRYAIEDQTKWHLSDAQRTKSTVIQILVGVKGTIKPEYAFGQTLDLEDTIPLL
jgi:phage baseplate assembly protein W